MKLILPLLSNLSRRARGSLLTLMLGLAGCCFGLSACNTDNQVCSVEIPDECLDAASADVDADNYYNKLCEGQPGYESVQKWDCNDADALVNPDAPETCDGRDNDCDDLVDNSQAYDDDADGFLANITECRTVYEASSLDCDDKDPNVNPSRFEAHDGIDNDCDGIADEDFDLDGDGYSVAMGDCDDDNVTVGPASAEICSNDGSPNGVDEDCDAVADDICPGSSTSYEAGYDAGYAQGVDDGLAECN